MTGIICFHKPEQITSFSAVARLRRITGEKKAGHAGTLDPMATGVLPVFFGGATRFIELLPDHTKGYRTVIRLGVTTDTLDRTGTVLSTAPVTAGREQVCAALAPLRGEIDQLPPMYSALKKDGVRLYELARQGIEIERETRRVTVERLECVEADEENGLYTLEIVCSKGTYVRSLAASIGESLGCGAVMESLCRTYAAGFSLEEAVTLEQAEALAQADRLSECVISLEQALSAYPPVTVTKPQAVRFANGGALALDRLREADLSQNGALARVYGPERDFLGIGEVNLPQEQLAVKRVYQAR